VLAYSDPNARQRDIAGLLDDYAFTANACLDAYETTSDLSYFKFARRIADAMIERFGDPVGGGFFDTPRGNDELGVLSSRRKPFQDSPTPAGNAMAAIALIRLHAYTNEHAYRDKGEQTLEVFAGVAERYGIFAGTYGIAAVHFSQPHTQVVVVGEDHAAAALETAALKPFAFNKAVIKLTRNEAAPSNLPPGLAETIPNAAQIQTTASFALICSGFTCQTPITDPELLAKAIAPRRERAA
jgi:uncharacterized protein YyaL (SSP411 family)